MEKALTTLVRSLLVNSGDRRLASQEGVRWGRGKGLVTEGFVRSLN